MMILLNTLFLSVVRLCSILSIILFCFLISYLQKLHHVLVLGMSVFTSLLVIWQGYCVNLLYFANYNWSWSFTSIVLCGLPFALSAHCICLLLSPVAHHSGGCLLSDENRTTSKCFWQHIFTLPNSWVAQLRWKESKVICTQCQNEFKYQSTSSLSYQQWAEESDAAKSDRCQMATTSPKLAEPLFCRVKIFKDLWMMPKVKHGVCFILTGIFVITNVP